MATRTSRYPAKTSDGRPTPAITVAACADSSIGVDTARDFLTGIGIELPTGRRPLVRYCVDWTEQLRHLSGGLGRAVFDHFLSAGPVKRVPRVRALMVTDDGRTALADAFGIDWSCLCAYGATYSNFIAQDAE